MLIENEMSKSIGMHYPVGGYVCKFQGLTSRLNKLKKSFKKTDRNTVYLANRIKFLFNKLNEGSSVNLTEMLARRHRDYTEEMIYFLKKIDYLKKEIDLVEDLLKTCIQCDTCFACKPNRKLQRSKPNGFGY